MRRPALHHPTGLADTSAWAHPYPTSLFSPVFYSSGAVESQPVPAAVPSPADLAARAAAQQVLPSQPEAVPPGQRTLDDDREVLADKYTGQPMTQGRFNKIMSREHTKGRNAALRELAEAAGVTFDPEDFDPRKFGNMFKEAEKARQAQLSEEQRRSEQLAERERAAEAREAAALARETAAARRDRESNIRAALVRLGATGDDLDDAAALLRVPDNADEAAIAEAATALKDRRGELFGAATLPAALPPAPGGAPAGGPPQRTPAGGKDVIKDAARARARSMGLRTDDAA
ncbi:hypothetical protein ACFRCX_30380 [Streptomyces sp. NPDC056652]|uniref:hypothetical protein n=1 Tax=Streptomyces sp. NPDC056652 TaxID=3345893 RepID=UPI00367F08E6